MQVFRQNLMAIFSFNDYYTGNLPWVLRQSVSNWNLVAGIDATNFGTGFSYVSDWAVGPDGAIYYVYPGWQQACPG